MTPVVIVCDDEAEAVTRWTKRLTSTPVVTSAFEVRGKTDFAKDVEVLEQRRAGAREQDRTPFDQPCLFDDAAILIVDFDLLRLGGDTYVTGETVAYLARCYAASTVIVVLNQFGENPFDLTLRGHPRSFADLNLGAMQITNAALWGGDVKGFHPWAWPALSILVGKIANRIDALIGGALDQPIVDVLQLPQEIVALLPRAAREFLEGAESVERITFRQFVDSADGGLQRKDKLIDDRAYARVAAARVGKWCDRLLAAEQDLVVDAPHLALRFPSLLSGAPDQIETWNSTAESRDDSWSSQRELLKQFAFPKPEWLTRPAWFGKQVGACNEIREVSDPWSIKDYGLVFCEDLSRFVPRRAAKEFVADLESPYVRRFVGDPESTELREIADELRSVDYRPSVRFSL